MKQGLQQGSVLSPLVFIFFNNNLAELMPRETQVTFFTDEVTLLATHKDRALAKKKAQALVDIVATWSKEWKLSLNADKCEASFLSINIHKANWSPSIDRLSLAQPVCLSWTPTSEYTVPPFLTGVNHKEDI